MITLPKTSSAAFANISQIGAVLSGQKKPVPFAQLFDDGTGTFPKIEPGEARVKQEGGKTSVVVGDRVVRNLLLALRRDARHHAATRGKLLLHAAQTRCLGMYEAGNQLSLCFK